MAKSPWRTYAVCLVVLALAAAACTGTDENGSDPASEESTAEVSPGPTGEGDTSDEGRGPTLEALSADPITMDQAMETVLQTAAEASAEAVTFSDVGAELGYAHMPPPRFAQALELYRATAEVPATMQDAAAWPADPYGTVGVAIFDADGDDDLDIYVTNAAGTPNSLYLNQLTDTGSMGFVEDAVARGVAATDTENTGVCHGDVDNDGDSDLFVVGNGSPYQLFKNDGAGTFSTDPGVPAGDSIGGTTCAMGDVTGDGLLDIAVGHTFDHATSLALVVVPYDLNLHNELLIQQLDGSFVEDGAARGIRQLQVLPEGAAGITWGVALVDVDADGDLDLVATDDQTTMPNSNYGGMDRGLIQVFDNDGTGKFQSVDAGTLIPGTWMGTAWADFNCDRTVDMFAGNFGDYGFPTLGVPYTLGDYPSRWLLGDGDGGFFDPGVGDLGTTHFAWGGVAEDFDNDGDPDLIFHGGLDASLLVDLSNPGTYLTNDGCDADFTWQREAFDVNHIPRLVTGTAAGDLNGDGFVDVVTAASFVVPAPFPVFPLMAEYGLDTDGTGFFTSPFMPTDDGRFSYIGVEFTPGDLTVEINSGNGNNAVAVRPVGSVGLTDDAVVPRSAFGAVVSVSQTDGRVFTKPLQGGTGYLSADSPVINAGIGRADSATVEIAWPGGVRNRFYDVGAGTTLVAPEIPCSYTDSETSLTAYTGCVATALANLADAGIIDDSSATSFLEDALRARDEG